jgi:hypothetical protein
VILGRRLDALFPLVGPYYGLSFNAWDLGRPGLKIGYLILWNKIKLCIDEMAQEWHLADSMAGYGKVMEMIPLWPQVLAEAVYVAERAK